MSTARWADWSSMHNLTLLHTLVQSESADAKYGPGPEAVTYEHKKELAKLREEYKALFEGSRIQRADEWGYRYHIRQNVMDVWDIRTPPSLALQLSGDVSVRSHTRPCHEGEAEENLITAFCELNDRLARFDLNKSLLTGSSAVPKILSPQAAACLTELRADSLNLFDKLRDEYSWTAAIRSSTGRQYVNQASRSLVFGAMNELSSLNAEYRLRMTRYACRALRLHEKTSWNPAQSKSGVTSRSTPEIRRLVARNLVADVGHMIDTTLDAAQGTSNVSPARQFLLTQRIRDWADVIYRDLTAADGPDETIPSMDTLKERLGLLVDEYTADLRGMSQQLLIQGGSSQAKEMTAARIQSIAETFSAWRPLTTADLRRRRSHRCQAELLQGLRVTTELRLTALCRLGSQGDRKEKDELRKLAPLLEGEVQKHTMLAGTIPEQGTRMPTSTGRGYNMWYWGESESFELEPGYDSESERP